MDGFGCVVGMVCSANVPNNATNIHRTPPIIANARKSSQRTKRQPMVVSEKREKRGFCEKFKRTLSWKNTMVAKSVIETAEFAVLKLRL